MTETNAPANYPAAFEAWRKNRLDKLKAADGWLNIIARFWLETGTVSVGSAQDNDLVLSAGPAHLGALTQAEDKTVTFLPADGSKPIHVTPDEEHPDGFLSVDELGFGSATAEGGRLPGVQAVVGTILTVTCATGTDERAAELTRRYPEAVGEAMEGYGVAAAAALFDLPFAEIRAVSNFIGRREREAWRIGPALAALTAAARPIAEGLQAC